MIDKDKHDGKDDEWFQYAWKERNSAQDGNRIELFFEYRESNEEISGTNEKKTGDSQ